MDMDLKIVNALPDDAKILSDIAYAAKSYWHYPENWLRMWRELLTITPDYILQHETHKAVLNGEIVGFFALDTRGVKLELLHLWVHPDHIGKGIGRALMARAIEVGKETGMDVMEMETDPNAEKFFIKMNAHRVGVRIYRLDGQQRTLPLLFLDLHGPGRSSIDLPEDRLM